MLYYLVFALIYPISLLPFFILYAISDVAFFVLYVLVGYRKTVVMANLRHSFPEKSEAELKKIARKFYRNFCDNWVETIKLLSISRAQLNKRMSGNFEIFDQLHASGRAVQVNLGHFFNWEMMTLHTGINQPYTFLTVYLPQNSQAADKLLQYIRGRFGNPLLASTEMARAIMPWRKKQYLLALGADQSPALPESGSWMYFMHQPTIFPIGAEKFARMLNLPVVMMNTTKPRRGHYHFEYYLLANDVKALPDGELLRQYVRHLEENIRLQPELYLWTHRRWKHAWKPQYAPLWVDNLPAPQG